ncbi:MAG TPA: outer membrane protein assembly factor BamA [Candidatus Binatia bacterium]|jgi:outer membrane protein insertion porin family
MISTVCNLKLPIAIALAVSLPFFFSPVVHAQSVTLKEVKIQGNIRVEEEGVRLHLQARAGEAFDPTVVEKDVKSIYRMGFFDDVQAELSPEAVLTYSVKEKPYVNEVKIQGNSQISKEKVETAFGIAPRTILDRDKIVEGIGKVKKLYSEQGYVNASVDYTVTSAENNQAVVSVDIEEGNRLLVKRISFQGNRSFSEKDLKGLMGTKEEWFLSFITNRGVLDHDSLSNDMAILASHYYDHGFINHKIADPVILRNRQGIEIVIRIDEGEQYRVGKVEVGGDMVEDPKLLLKKMQLTQGQIFRGSRLRQDISNLTDTYADKGFAFAQVDPVTKINPKEKNVDIALVVTKGPPVYFNHVLVSGNNKTRDKVVRRAVVPAEQELYSSNKVKQSRSALQRTGYFEDVQLSTKKTDQPDAVDLLVDVKEAPTGTFSVGAGYSSGDAFVFNAGIQEKNLFGRGQAVNLNADLGTRRQDFVLGFKEPYLLDTPLSLGVEAFNSQRDYSDFSVRRTGFDIDTSYPLRRMNIPFLGLSRRPEDDLTYDQPHSFLDFTKVGIGYELIQSRLGDFQSEDRVLTGVPVRDENGKLFTARDPFADAKEKTWTSSIGPTLSYDSRDHFFHPTEGWSSRMGSKFAGLGGDNQYIKNDVNGKYYYPLLKSPTWGNYTLSVGGTFGYGIGLGGANGDGLPFFDRYYAGGINSVRGFTDRSLAPHEKRVVCRKIPKGGDRNPDDGCGTGSDPHIQSVIVGGDKLVVGNFETTFPIMEQYGLRGVAFFDMGNAFDAFRFSDLRRSVGVGGRWLSPFGPLRVELGFPLNKQRGDDTSVIGFALGGQQ